MAEMSDGNASPASGTQAAQQAGLKTTAMICYGLYLAGLVMGVTVIIGAIIAYIKKSDAVGSVWESHFRNLIVVFWVMLAAFIFGLATVPIWLYSIAALFENDVSLPAVSAVAFPLFAGMLSYLALFIWFLYRMIRGLMRAAEDRAY